MTNKKTKLGIEENIEALLCYAGAWITGIIFLLLEKENEFVRFHAMQSLLTFLGLFVIGLVYRNNSGSGSSYKFADYSSGSDSLDIINV